ncbi:MAG TPA: formate--tetrahydrofolate ligase [Fimbriimonadaceae bacterium]|nr:formate--tetrahydrofolate ligase [Fimbriimonadaceae bacterium]
MTNLDIAQAARLRPIEEIAGSAGLGKDDYDPLGRYKAKLTYSAMNRLAAKKRGRLVLVTAVTPTPAGEGKTTMTIGLTQALNKIGKTAVSATREPALGPVFGVKGGAAGGGYSQVLPMEDINLFFNGDMSAIAAAHNLCSAMLDAHVHNGNTLDVDVRMPVWPRTVDMNDRALRNIVVGLGGRNNGYAHEDGFVVTPASEVMAVLCLSKDITDLKERLGKIIVAVDKENAPITAKDIKAPGAMAALLRDAIRPNLVQTIEGAPALIHGGPFGNIAHGCSSIIATSCALGMADFAVTEAGFASDLGAEKFMHIKVPHLGKSPDVVVLVATVRALKHHGDGDLAQGTANLERHIRHLKQYGVPIVVAVNRFTDDAQDELDHVVDFAKEFGADAVVADPWNSGGEGCTNLASLVAQAPRSQFSPIYAEDDPFETKLQKIVVNVYGGDGFELSRAAKRRLKWVRQHGFDQLPVCIAKTQASLSDDRRKKNAPTGFTIEVDEIRPSAGAGFLVVVCGDMLLMPGLGKTPAAFNIDVDKNGVISGLV